MDITGYVHFSIYAPCPTCGEGDDLDNSVAFPEIWNTEDGEYDLQREIGRFLSNEEAKSPLIVECLECGQAVLKYSPYRMMQSL